ncbi:MAG: hypothetical protein ACTSYW_00340 [Candidatus Heimdallarchaeota archaeon]
MLKRRKKHGFGIDGIEDRLFVDQYWSAIVAAVLGIGGLVTKVATGRSQKAEMESSSSLLGKIMLQVQNTEKQMALEKEKGQKRTLKDFVAQRQAQDSEERKQRTRYNSYALGRKQISNIFTDINRNPAMRQRFIDLLGRGR